MTVNFIWNYSLLGFVHHGNILQTGKMNRRWQFLLPPVHLLGFKLFFLWM